MAYQLTTAKVWDGAKWVAAAGGVAPWPILPIGDPLMGGFYAGVIDTTQPGSILASDDYQVGSRYALIVAPQSLEGGRDTAVGDLPWHTVGSQSPTGASTRWDGLAATDALRQLSADYEAATYAWGLTFPTDDGSRWYLPAMDELELLWRNLKPIVVDNYVTPRPAQTFPGGADFPNGLNDASDPQGAAYTLADPAKTSVAAFQTGGAEAMSSSHGYWTSAWASSSGAWYQLFSIGAQVLNTQAATSFRVRPCRRVVL